MSRINRETTLTVRAPILIDVDQLRDLEEIVRQELERLNKSREQEIDGVVTSELDEEVRRGRVAEGDREATRSAVEARVRARHRATEPRTKLLLNLSGRRKAAHASFDEALRSPDYEGIVVEGFELLAACGDVRAVMQGPTIDGGLTVAVFPEGDEGAQSFYFSLQEWARRVAAPKWQQWWRGLSGIQWFVYLLVAWIGATIAADSSSAERSYREEAARILDKGVTTESMPDAVRVTLALVAKHVPASKSKGTPVWFFATLVSGLLICVVLSFVPRFEVAIGRGSERISRWRRWISIVFYGIPAFIAVNLLGPKLYELVWGK